MDDELDELNELSRELGAMEFFILALIAIAGLNSLYLFQKRAGLQPGGIRPALKRLETLNLIERAESSKRQRRAISLTSIGLEVLNLYWRRCLVHQNDAEAALRATCVALLMGDSRVAIDYSRGVYFARQSDARDKELESERLSNTLSDPLSLYAWARALTEAQKRGAEGKAFAQLSQYLEANRQLYEKPQQQPVIGVQRTSGADLEPKKWKPGE